MSDEIPSLRDKISQVLEEIRVVMPGSQALLGFQLVALFSTGFDALTQEMRILHLISLGFIALATLFLMAPSAYHRIACHGNITKAVHSFASRMLVIAMFFLLAGLSTDIFVATWLIRGSDAAWLAAIGCFVIGSTLWFLYPTYLSKRVNRKSKLS